MLEIFIGLLGAIIGSILTMASSIIWDNHKNKKRFKSLLGTVSVELRKNQERVNDTIKNLPSDIRKKINKKREISLSKEEVDKLGWRFAKPYPTDAWNALISSGLIVMLPNDLFQELYKMYDLFFSINFLSNVSINFFGILASPNKLDKKTNENFDIFCKGGAFSQEIAVSKKIQNLIDKINKIIQPSILQQIISWVYDTINFKSKNVKKNQTKIN